MGFGPQVAEIVSILLSGDKKPYSNNSDDGDFGTAKPAKYGAINLVCEYSQCLVLSCKLYWLLPHCTRESNNWRS